MDDAKLRLVPDLPEIDPNDPLMQRIAVLERQIRDGLRSKLKRGIRVNPYITVMALGRLCEKHHVVAHVGWTDGMLEIDLLPVDVEVIPS